MHGELTVTWVTQRGPRDLGREHLLIQAKFAMVRQDDACRDADRAFRGTARRRESRFADPAHATAVTPSRRSSMAWDADHGPVASRVPLAQRYFHQGMTLTWGFNPAEAARSFEAATGADPRCALCWWGLAWALGPNINSDMDAGAATRVRAALAKARALAPQSSPRTRALIDALSVRHPRRRSGTVARRGGLRDAHAGAGPRLSERCRHRDARRRSAAQSASVRLVGRERRAATVDPGTMRC